ncbi:outer membrane beta-barrel protein [Tropicibacter sp. R16_0]|uniref:outer membrane protein n=1 Tax=Tropicibacter sp. R16_0 TaxID=2821102 RepID=UPI001AD9A234|nr:outer membrane beta-barrel protein [Tropicibacter sp. R16_0]MBO9450649.1 outer membrane beta-barrel protein [Tropicibacter sp. R16_0]
MRPRPLIAAAALTLSATALSAQTLPDGYYVQGFLGYNQLQDTNLSGTIGGAPQSVFGDFDGGYGIGIAVGREIPQWSNSNVGTRVELELSYRNNDVETLNFTGNGPGNEVNTSGDISSSSLFANVLFDFKQQGAFTPFLGFGLGAQRTSYDLVYGPGVVIRDSDTNFAAQAIAGVSYDLNSNTALTVDARYSRAFGASSSRLNPAGVSTGNVEDDLDNFSVNLGVRFKF